MLIVYPNTDYDTFCSLIDADALILANVPEAQHLLWDALTDLNKEVHLRQATILIKNKIQLPGTLEDDLKLACAYLANSSVGEDITDGDGSTGNVKVKEIVGVVKTEWFGRSKSNDEFPNLVNLLLSQYEVSSSSSFSFERA